jgi:hypothetical protein
MIHERNKNFLTKSKNLCYTDKDVKAIHWIAFNTWLTTEKVKQMTLFKFTCFLLLWVDKLHISSWTWDSYTGDEESGKKKYCVQHSVAWHLACMCPIWKKSGSSNWNEQLLCSQVASSNNMWKYKISIQATGSAQQNYQL